MDESYYRTIVDSKIWKEWTKYQEHKMEVDIWESIELGLMSKNHWDKFIKWVVYGENQEMSGDVMCF